KEGGGRTIVQDELTSVIFGMPKAAIEMGVADKVVPLPDIIDEIMRLL
ncbi:MAG: chemotaxis response regulator protein-glutamate methylesterase, partial [Proteobacteria bacterium]|nr:chemotaxis response regulator protein-glutamate methylesterase [Pseudomonadota bacterium]